ncbi:hypothetical protein TVAG_267090 [Trichomonas vaginalis G3]|uniref:Uncharacterized protein n=1 Tax=Trichomonas vaginalis (strain ATCC PRA-98 / G3) TaxID=412133 RepID=A2F547_TRIV3|nr:hypothetical protein TVAG_267090 [Trichomonas vaginalis G3]|eukprot:XP_001312870.1 hypothetical protein [Trichomonas vaginalis G3]
MNKPPSLKMPKYDLRKNIPAPDISWDDFTPIKDSPTLFSPQSPRFAPFYENYKAKKNQKKKEFTISHQESYIIDIEPEILKKIELNDQQTQTEAINIQETQDTPQQNTEPMLQNRLFMPKFLEDVDLKYRPFGTFGASTRRLTAAEKRQLKEKAAVQN